MKTRNTTAKWLESQQTWRVRVRKNGQTKSFYSNKKGRKGQRECNLKADLWLNSNVIESSVLVKDFSRKYLDWKKERVSTSRYNNLKAYFNKTINDIIGNKRVSNLTEQDLQTVLDFMFKSGYSYAYTYALKNTLEELIKFARKNGITDLRPEFLEVQRRAKKEIRGTFTEEDLKILFSEDTTKCYGVEDKDIFINSYRFLALTGLRRGEMLGLKWSDIEQIPSITDQGAKTIVILHIERSINEYKEITSGKTDNTQRDIPLTDSAIQVLNEQGKMLRKLHITSEYIFCDRYGETPSPSYYSQRFKKYCEYHNLSRHKVHELRHTFISFNKDTMTLSQLKNCVGHSPRMETIATYGHALKSDLAVIRNELENSLLNDIFRQKMTAN